MQQKDYSNNFISDRSSTKVIHAPGGGSSIGSLLFGGGGGGGGGNDEKQQQSQQSQQQQEPSQTQQINKENKNDANIPKQQFDEKCNSEQSDAEKVREFTFEAGQPTPDKPQLMNVDEVNFIAKMILDELLELYATVLSPEQAKKAMKKMIDEAKNIEKLSVSPNELHELIGEQGDAFVDIWYYSLNCMAKKGVNLSKIFNLVHAANMDKKDPKTGKFIKRSDGKILKRKGWLPPNVGDEIKRQITHGSWQ